MAFAAGKGDWALAPLVEQFDIRSNQINLWKAQLEGGRRCLINTLCVHWPCN